MKIQGGETPIYSDRMITMFIHLLLSWTPHQALDHMPTLKPVKQHQINNFRNYGLRGFIMLTNKNRYKHPKPGKFGALTIDQL